MQQTKEPLTFKQLEDLFLKQKEKVGKVGLSSIKMYKAALKDLMEYFQNININELKYQDFENFQNFLIAKGLNNKTINNKITYLRMFLDYAEKFELIEKNFANKLEMLKEEVKEKENFTGEEINSLLENASQEFKDFLKVAMFTGMRLQEILAIKEILTDSKTKIKYIQVGDSKTASGIRKVPLHGELLNIKFPLFDIKNDDVRTFSTNIGKRINRYIETIAKEKTIHTFRATFINKIVNNFPDRIEIAQELVGHSKGNKTLILNTYSKEFDISLKKEIVDSVKYGQN
ncbi:Tyrosine recombinase XerC [Sulfurospirillum diekertiae]|uniref:Tyrosine recombinase XerC n=1 Tax=Sulfurospirillum diekertiae TaxID=1854492 RepID=A0A290HUH5_9BACT|nr:phage integrase SAM-like domain-containing protein [Sulfurospirillum diekertiae]ATB70294.1 Tyrosine recombinase XerC [Sulfurospirillum diekertiae]